MSSSSNKKIQTPKGFISLQYPLGVIYVLILGVYACRVVRGEAILVWDVGDLLYPIILLILVFTHVYYHEFAHYITAKSFGYEAEVTINKKQKKKVCMIKGDIKPGHFITIAIMPFLFDVLLFLFLLYLYSNLFILVAGFLVIAIAGAISDIWLFFKGIPLVNKKGCYLENIDESHFVIKCDGNK